MKLVREYINEKFTDKSDPIHDMGIGDPLHIAGSYLQKFADKNGYHFEMKKNLRCRITYNYS